MDERRETAGEARAERAGFNRWWIVAVVAAVLAGLLLASTIWENRVKDDDNLAGNAVAEPKQDPEKWCAAQATYDAMRRELFRRAAQVRGSDQEAYTRLADFALLRVNGPVVRGIDERLNSVSCSGAAVLSLPPGVVVAGGRRSLSADIDYVIQPAADGTGNVVRLGNADGIVVPLATLARTAARQPPPVATEVPSQVVPSESAAPGGPQAAEPQQQAPTPARANPSFDCDRARTRGEVAVCGDPGLAALDRQMAAQYNAAVSEAEASQRRLLERTRGRFLSYRDRCATNECVAETYRGRMREIRDIMTGRWRG